MAGSNPYTENTGFPVQILPAQAWSVAAVDVQSGANSGRILFLGTNDGAALGEIRVILDDPLNGPQTLTAWSNGGALPPVYTLAATTVFDNHVVLLAGTACAGLFRFDIPTQDFFTLPMPALSPSATWNPSAGGYGTFVRDVIIEETHKVAFVAAYSRGAFRLDINGLGLLAPSGSPWPIKVGPSLYYGLAFSPNHDQLVVALGPGVQVEVQYYGSCSFPLSCDGGPSGAVFPDHGVQVYDLHGPGYGGSFAQDAAFSVLNDVKFSAMAVATRDLSPPQEDTYWIDTAFEAHGYHRLLYQPLRLTLSGGIAQEQGALLGSSDDVVMLQGNVYVGFETGVTGFDPSSGLNVPVPTSQPIHEVSLGSGVLLTTLASPAWLIGGANNGVTLYDLQAGSLSAPSPLPMLNNNGRLNYFLCALDAPSATTGTVLADERWLYVINNPDYDSPIIRGPGLKVWDIEPVITAIPPDMNQKQLRVHYLDELAEPPGSFPVKRQFGGVAVKPVDANTQAVYIAYGPEEPVYRGGILLASGETNAGVVALKVHASPPIYRVERTDIVPAFLGVPTEPVARVWLDGNTLYAAYGCNGVAKFDVSNPFHPTVQGTRPNPGWSALQAIEHGGDVYTTYMSGGISKEPAASFGSGQQTFYGTRFQANALCPDPYPLYGNGFYLADGRGGLHRINIP